MPFEITMFQLPCGARAARVDFQETITGEDAAALVQQHAPGGPLHGIPTVVMTGAVDRVTADARSAFGGRDVTEWTALVMTKPLMRVTASFIIRVTGSPRMRIFGSEPEAVQWLDARAREDAAKVKTGAP